MLRTEAEAALHDLLAYAREAADLYADDAEALAGTDLAELFERLAERRDSFACGLEEQIRLMGDLPTMPDADRETFERLGNRLRAALVPDSRQALLEDRIAAEQELQRLIEAALVLLADEGSRALLKSFLEDSRTIQIELESRALPS